MRNYRPHIKLFRNIGSSLFLLACLLWTPSDFVWAGGPFTGTFDPSLGLIIHIYPEGSSTEVSSMNFGTLTPFTDSNGGQTLRCAGGFKVMIYPQPTGHTYQITCTGTVLTNSAGNTLPSGACVVAPSYSGFDNDFGAGPTSMPADASVGTSGPWGPSSRVLYNSGFNGEYRAIQAHFAITDDGNTGATAAVRIDQPSGSYTGTVVISIVE